MPLKVFPQFRKLPLEIRRRIWNLSFAPRVIRVENKNTHTTDYFKSIYHLNAGPVPRLLQINHESRAEGLRTYTLVASQIPYFSSANIPSFQSNFTPKIYVDLERDTFYVVKIQTTSNFVTWLRRLGTEKYGGAGDGVVKEGAVKHEGDESLAGGLQAIHEKGFETSSESFKTSTEAKKVPSNTSKTVKEVLKHLPALYSSKKLTQPLPKSRPGQGIRNLAFSASTLICIQDSPFRTFDFLLSIAMLQPNLKTLGIVLDCSQFETTKHPEKYELRNPQPLSQWVLGSGSCSSKWGTDKMRSKMGVMLEGFWTRQHSSRGQRATTTTVLYLPNGQIKKLPQVKELWEKWINDETRKDGQWKGPEFVMWGLGKVNKLVL